MRTRRGFTLVELMLVLAVIAVLVGVAVPTFRGMMKANQMRALVREFVQALYVARSNASSGVTIGAGPSKARAAGITINSPTTYNQWLDDDALPGGEITTGTIDLKKLYGPNLTVVVNGPPAGTMIRFLQDGTVPAPLPPPVSFFDVTLNKTITVTVNAIGKVTIND